MMCYYLNVHFQGQRVNFVSKLCNNQKERRSHVQGGSNMTGTDSACLHTNQSRSYLNHLVHSGGCLKPLTLYLGTLPLGVDRFTSMDMGST